MIMERKLGETNVLEKEGLVHENAERAMGCHISSDVKMPWIMREKEILMVAF